MIFSKLNLEQYIEKCNRQKEALQTSTIFGDYELKTLTETYNLQIEFASRKLDRMNSPNITEIKNNKKHTLVFYKSSAILESFFFQFMDNFSNCFQKQNFPSYENNKVYITKQTELIAIHHVIASKEVQELINDEFIQINNEKVHSIPLLIGCDFDIKELPQTIIDKCNIIKLN